LAPIGIFIYLWSLDPSLLVAADDPHSQLSAAQRRHV
jgi:hypothetical protein